MKRTIFFVTLFVILLLVGCDIKTDVNIDASSANSIEQSIDSMVEQSTPSTTDRVTDSTVEQGTSSTTDQSNNTSGNEDDNTVDSSARVEPFVPLRMYREYNHYEEEESFVPSPQFSIVFKGTTYEGTFSTKNIGYVVTYYEYNLGGDVEFCVDSNGDLVNIFFRKNSGNESFIASDEEYKIILDEIVSEFIDVEQYEFRLDPVDRGKRSYMYMRCVDGMDTYEYVTGLIWENGELHDIFFSRIGTMSNYTEIDDEAIEKATVAVNKRMEEESKYREEMYLRKEHRINEIRVHVLKSGQLALEFDVTTLYHEHKGGEIDYAERYKLVVAIE